jgi:hypothetical protein
MGALNGISDAHTTWVARVKWKKMTKYVITYTCIIEQN